MLPNDNQDSNPQWDPTVLAYLQRQKDAQAAQDATNQQANFTDNVGLGTDIASALAMPAQKQTVFLQHYNDTSAPKTTQQYQPKANGDQFRQEATNMRAAGVAKKAADLKDAGQVAEMENQGHSRQLQDAAEGRNSEEFGWKQGDQSRKTTQQSLEDDKTSDVSKTYQLLAKKLISSGDFSNMSATQLKESIGPLEKMYSADNEKLWKQAQIQSTQQNRQDIISQKQQEAADKQEQKDSLTTVPGYDHDPKIGVRPEDAAKMRTASNELNAFKNELGQYRDLIKENGSFEFGGAKGEQMASLATSIKMRLKNMYELGALSGPDMGIISSQIRDPSSMGALFSKDDSTIAGLDQTLKTIDTSVNSKLAGSGYKKHQDVPNSFPRQVANAKTGETATVSDANELNEANQHGFQ